MSSSGPYIVTLDVGTSSVRTLLFNSAGREQAGFGEHQTFQIAATHDGGVEFDPDELLRLCVDCLAKLHAQMQNAGIQAIGVAVDTFWHSLLGIDRNGAPTTPIIHLFDTRSQAQVVELSARLDPQRVHARTGCRLHTSYWPSKLLWLSSARPAIFAATRHWISFGEYLFLRLFGDPVASTSMASGTGLWLQAGHEYDPEMLRALPVDAGQLAPPGDMDRPCTKLLAPYHAQWPLFAAIPWFPALGDGACNNVGSGCATAGEFCLMVGTSGPLRAVIEAESVAIPDGLWCYRVDRKRFVLGGSLSNGGDVYAWMNRTLKLPSPPEAEAEIARMKPGAHGLLLLPFFAGERSPYWRADLRAAIIGMDLATRPTDILRAALESVALRFLEIYGLMAGSLGLPRHVVASGGALLASPAWTQMMADALAIPVFPCLEHEATSRGGALLAFERLGVIGNVTGVECTKAPPLNPVAENTAAYLSLESAQKRLFHKLFDEP